MVTEHKYPLVSIIVITYNSAKYVIETLESTKAQTYQNIELIISDDCSTDNTFNICHKWIEENKSFFFRAELLTAENNTGISANCNRGYMASSGSWLKIIAGDDILANTAIEELVQYVTSYKDAKIKFLVSGLAAFNEETEFLPIYPPLKFTSSNASQQLKYLLKRRNCVSGSTFFLERSTFNTLGGFDINYPMFEDLPLLIKYTQNNFKIWCLNKPLIRYRIHTTNISFGGNASFMSSTKKYTSDVIIPLWKKEKMYLWLWHYYLDSLKTNKSKSVIRILSLLSPLEYLIRFYDLFGKSYYSRFNFIPKPKK